MQNWTDKIIHWNQLPGTEVKRLLATWGQTPEQIAKYDKKHGFDTAPAKAVAKTESTTPIKETKKATAAVPKKAAVASTTRKKHTGADGAIKFVEHRNLYVGFLGGKVVVTKRTVEACQVFLLEQFGVTGVLVDQ